MLIEQSIEAKLVERIKALGFEGVPVFGVWSPTASGVVKGTEGDAAAAIVVRVSPRTFDTFGICEATMDVSITLTVRIDLCPTGAEIAEYWGGISDLVAEWNLAATGAELADFAVDGFEPGGVHVTGGEGPVLDGGAWTVTQDLSLRGTVPHGNAHKGNDNNE